MNKKKFVKLKKYEIYTKTVVEIGDLKKKNQTQKKFKNQNEIRSGSDVKCSCSKFV